MATVTANNLKVHGVSSIEKALKDHKEVIISVRGVPRYVVMAIEDYDELRENEIMAAWLQVRQDIKEGRFVEESADAHMARIRAELGDEL